jgi:glucose-fructose oxidoreductase
VPTRRAPTSLRRARARGARIRYAVLGQGYISQVAVLPAFAHAGRNSELAALVSDDADKLRVLGRRYGVRSLHTYDEFDELLASGRVDAVYIALPNHLHLPFAVAAARAGVHVLCEKPLAVTEEDCEEIVAEADRNRVKLMTAYRLHFERANLEAIQVARGGRLGSLRTFSSVFSMQVAEGNIRLKAEYGGGPLYDLGIYCINAARYLFRDEPIEVSASSANSGDPRFREVEEMTAAVLRFPRERLATFTCSFGAAAESTYDLVGTKGSLRLEPAYTFEGRIRRRLTVGGRTSYRSYTARDQFAAELIYFSDCIKKGRDPEPSGWEGWADVRVISALLRSAQVGRTVVLERFEKRRRPDVGQEILRPPVRERELVGASPPTASR